MPTKRHSGFCLTASVIIAAIFTVFGNSEAQAQRGSGGKSASSDRAAAPMRATPSRSIAPTRTAAPSRSAGVTRAAPANRSVARPTIAQKSPASSRPMASQLAPRLASPSPRTVSRPSGPNLSAPSGNSGRPVPSSSVELRPGFAREPLVRAPQPAASDMPRGKAPPGVFSSQSRDSRPLSYSPRPIDRRSGDLSVQRDDNRDRGLVHLGADRDRAHLAGGQYNHAYHNQGHNYYRPYGYGHYYNNYRPIYYPGCNSYNPYWGYSYASAYLAAPYFSYYDATPTYVSSSYVSEPPAYYVQQPAVTQVAPDQAPAAASPAAPADSYQTLTPEQQPPAAVVEGNAAFAAGRYDEARGLYVRAVMTDERDGYAKTLYAWANFALGDYEVAVAALRRALLTTPDLVDNPLDLRTFYPDRAILDRHSDALMRFLAEHPQNREAQLLWGYLLYSIGQAEPAALVFTSLAGADQNDTLLSLLREAAVRNARGSSPPPVAP